MIWSISGNQKGRIDMSIYLQDTLTRLLKITKGCREDMHEPDEQGVSAHVYGDHLDNAFGDQLFLLRSVANNDGPYPHVEFVVCIQNEDEITYEWFNLASLIALARKAVI